MTPGTTPTHTFTLPFNPQQGSKFCVVYAQGKEYHEQVVLELGTNRCSINGKNIVVKLTQEETLKFDRTPRQYQGKYSPYPVKIQIGIQTPDGNIQWSQVITSTVERLLKEDGKING